jgi:lysozyme
VSDINRARLIAAKLIAKLEACKLAAYPDPGSENGEPWTIGYGSTRGVKKGMKITKAEAFTRLVEDLSEAVTRLRAKVPPDVLAALTDHQAAALLSFVFNVGTGRLSKKEWTIWKVLRAKHFDQVPTEMLKFVNNDGRRMQGLVNRRLEEIRVWHAADPATVQQDPPSAVTRSTQTPPTVADPVPPAKSATLISGGIAAATTTTVAVQQLSAQVAPFALNSELVGKIVGALAVIGAIAVTVTFILTWLKKRRDRN